MAADNAFVLVEHENGIIAPVSRAHAEISGAKVVEGSAVDLTGKPVRPVRADGRPIKPKRNLPKASGATRSGASETAVTPTEGAANSTLTNPKE